MIPIFDEEDLKTQKLSSEAKSLQTMQNNMIRMILDLKMKDHIKMQNVREKIKMMSVNQMAVYHTLLETYNVVRNSTSEQIKRKTELK